MYLKRVEIQGFKSFADPVSIDFKEGLTCIIGPNGSGKSNISDALRWALGEQSAKTLRGGRMDEVIFAGTESRRPKGMAEVTLIFDNSESFLPIDYREVAIKRRLFRSGESEYFINNTQCRLRDVRELIMDTGIGVDGYSFVGQGRVDKIVSDKPETRREIFEEAAGVIKYKSQKMEARRKLESAAQNLDRMNDIIGDIESRIDGLREESEKAKEHAGLTSRYRELEVNITLKNIEGLQNKSRELKAQLEETNAELESRKGKRVSDEAGLAALRKRNGELEERGNELREGIANRSNRVLALKGDALVSEEKRRGAERDIERIKNESEALEARIIEEQSREGELVSEKADKDSRLEGLNTELGEKLKDAAARAAKLSGLEEGIESERNELFELSRERSSLEAELKGSRDLMGSMDESEFRLKDEISNAEAEAEVLAFVLDEMEADLAATGAEIDSLKEAAGNMQEAYENAAGKAADATNRLEALKIKSERINARRKTIEEMESNYEGYSQGARLLMNEKIPGIKGLVAELMNVPKGYENAVEAVLGAALQNVVCEDDGTAKAAIDFLKKNRAGRLTFLPIASIRPRKRNHPAGMERHDGFDGYAIDKVEFDKKYENIFDYLLGGVVLSKNLDAAVSMSKNNKEGYRIVTIDGEIINPYGALTGGAFKNKTANILERKAEIASLGEEAEGVAEEIAAAGDALEELMAESQRAIVSIRENDRLTRERQSAFSELSVEMKNKRYRLEELTQRASRGRTELSSLLESRERGEGTNETLNLRIIELGELMEGLENGIAEKTAQFQEERASSGNAAEEVTAIRLKVAEANAEKVAADANANRIRESIADMERRLRERAEEAEALEATLRESGEGVRIDAEIKAIEEEKEKFESELEGLVIERREIQLKIEEAEYSSSDMIGAIERLAESKNAMDVELGRQETRVAGWKEKLFDEFDLSYAQALELRDKDFVMSPAVKESRGIRERLLEIGEVNPGSIREYDETKERYEFLTAQREDILSSVSDYEKIVSDMDRISRARFKESFELIADNFDRAFKDLFGGGKGEIKLEDDADPLESGIEINIRPPGKANLVNIDGYSGGERSMIAIALMFAILKAKPSPFCILDEVDAALDETNIQRFCNYIMDFKETQFAIVTHQRSTMEYADALFGVTMEERGVTNILSLLLGDKETEDFAERLAEG